MESLWIMKWRFTKRRCYALL